MTGGQASSSSQDPAPALLTVREACARLNVKRGKLYDLIRSRQLETVKIGRSRRVPTAAVDEFVQRLRAEGAR